MKTLFYVWRAILLPVFMVIWAVESRDVRYELDNWLIK